MRGVVLLCVVPLCGVLVSWLSLPASAADRKAGFDKAHEHLQKGRYAEAAEAYDTLAGEVDLDPAETSAIVIARSRIHEEQGAWDEALAVVQKGVEQAPMAAKLWARLGQLQFRTGKYADAQKSVDEALKLTSQQPLARMVRAQLLTETGQTREALADYQWFVKLYNRSQPDDADVLLLVGEGSLQYARWKSVTSVFNFVLNTLCPDVLKADKLRWEASCLSGRLLLEKYNRRQAGGEFDAALKINPRCAEAYAGKAELALQDRDYEEAEEHADEALKRNPKLPAALAVKIELRIIGETPLAARPLIEQALAINPLDQRTLAWKEVCDLFEDGVPSIEEWKTLLDAAGSEKGVSAAAPTAEKGARFQTTWGELLARNPRPGLFLSTLGEALETQRKFDHAERCYETAIRVMPELSAPRTQLGMLYLRTGRTTEAEEILNAAFKADPFHVRLSNLRKMIGVLKEYDTITTDHFVIRIGHTQRALGLFMADYLEEVYAELVKEFQYEPPTRTQFEIYGDAKGQPAHAWFSTRMIGLPWIQTIGASTGRIVALASPMDVESPFNWAIVLKHEFVHILTLQATQFQIPHWYTEALAVRAEGTLLRDDWLPILRARYPDDLFTLDTVNSGFQRPKRRDDWDMAYCQSRLYADYLQKTYGDDAPARLLDAYRRQLTTTTALKELFGVEPSTFEKGFKEYVGRTLDEAGTTRGTPVPTLSAAKKKAEGAPEDRAAQAEYAYAMLRSRQAEAAKKLADKVIAADPKQPWAALVLARYHMSDKKAGQAIEVLRGAHDAEHPNSELVVLLGKLLLDDKKPEEAETLFRLGREKFPARLTMTEGLAAASLALKKTDAAYPLLVEAAVADQDDVRARKRLADLAWEKKDFGEAARWSREALYIDIEDAEMHAILAKSLTELGEHEKAARAWECLQLTDADNTEAPLGRSRELIAAGRPAEAKPVLEEFLKRNPEHTEARQLLDRLK